MRKKRNKYGAVKTEVDGIVFDSKKEARRYTELKAMEKAGEITNLQRQKRYTLQPAFELNGKKIREIAYISDFEYDDKDGQHHTVDVKGKILPVFKIKAKLFAYKFRYEIEIV